MGKTISEKIVDSVGTGADPAIMDTLEALTTTELAILDGATVTTAELNILDGVTATAAELNILDGVTATAAEINAAADTSTKPIAVTDAATYTVLAANTGIPHAVPDLTADCTISLPTAATGLDYYLYFNSVAADAQDWIIDTGSDSNYFVGGILFQDSAGTAANIEVPDGNSNSKLTVLTPAGGTWLRFTCNGTLWHVMGVIHSASAPTWADQ